MNSNQCDEGCAAAAAPVRIKRPALPVTNIVVLISIVHCLLNHFVTIELEASSVSSSSSSSQQTGSLAAAWRAQMQQSATSGIAGANSAAAAAAKPLPLQKLSQQQLLNIKQQQQHAIDSLNNLSAAAAATSSLSLSNDSLPNPNINNAGHEITKILYKFFEDGRYDKRVRPNYSGPPALVNVSFHIIGISSVSEVQMDFTTDFYFRQKWFDPRLTFEPVGKISELVVGAELAEKIWLPDTFFANEKTATFHKATTENTFIRVGHEGRVYRSIRLTVTCSCPMDLQYFPMDRQRCKIEIESYGYNTADINYKWGDTDDKKADPAVSLDGKIELPQFKVIGYKMDSTTSNLTSGLYIRLFCEIHFVRSMGYYLIQIYIPASLIVIISWVSFWLHRNATPARVALGVTTVLTMTTLMSSTNAALPKISYIKSIDVFLGTCFVMVFASLLEYASVGYIGKRIAMKRKYQMDLKQMQQHHQKVCVAAAASAAAAATAARQANPINVAHNLGYNDINTTNRGHHQHQHHNAKQLLVLQESQTRGSGGSGKTASATATQRPILMRRLTEVANELLGPAAAATGGEQHIITNKPAQQQQHQQQQQQPTQEPTDPSAVVISKAAAEQTGEGNVRICGLTPSDIDKYSRVVFPICFICFNLMYWIIYGHISQQIDDNGSPLIPFKKS